MVGLYPYQEKLLIDIESGGVKPGEMMIMMSGRQSGKTVFKQHYANMWNAIMNQPLKIHWKRNGNRVTAYTDNDSLRGLRDSDMDEVQQWVWNTIPTARRLSFDSWELKQEKHVTMFLLKWSS